MFNVGTKFAEINKISEKIQNPYK